MPMSHEPPLLPLREPEPEPLAPSVLGRPKQASDTLDASSDVVQARPSYRQHSQAVGVGLISGLASRSHTFPAVSEPKVNSNIPKRKPVAHSASSLASRFHGQNLSLDTIPSKPEGRFTRPCSVDSPTLYEYPARIAGQLPTNNLSATASPGSEHVGVPSSRNIPSNSTAVFQTESADVLNQDQLDLLTSNVKPCTAHDRRHSHAEPIVDCDPASDSDSVYSHNSNDNLPSSELDEKHLPPPPLTLAPLDTDIRVTSVLALPDASNKEPQLNKPLPKSPKLSKFENFYNWATSASPPRTSPPRSEFSSLRSPLSPGHRVAADDTPPSSIAPTFAAHIRDANATTGNPLEYCEDYLHTPPTPAAAQSTPGQIEEMEEELKSISAELAASIRREMDLEDLVDRLQAEANNPHAPGRRTSDYFSDSGYSSAKFSEFDHSREEIEKVQRRAEQEKAQIRLELTTKLQDERAKRKVLDGQIGELSQKASQIELARMHSNDATGRLKELERTCDQLRRKLSEEQTAKGNFEDLLSALKGELRGAANERDNLRDEIVPQLQARVEGLEAQAAEHSKVTYDTTKLQQELQTLKKENTNLRQSRSISEESQSQKSTGLARSNSTNAPFKLQKPPAGVARSNTSKQAESGEALTDRLKDVEAQRDALHNALRSLLERQEFQNRENEKKIRCLEIERDRLLALSPQKAGYEKDISSLRNEISVLRRRAEEAMEQKWQVEKGLIGLEMDLDRAEEEIAALRSLLEANDILIPASISRPSSGDSAMALPIPVTSASLEKAYKDMKAAYAESLERIKKLELGSASAPDEKTQLAIERLEQSLSTAASERDAAKQEASAHKAQIDSLMVTEAKHLESERALADELRESVRRVEELATQVRQQLAANSSLRQRLADTVSRGEAERKANAERIADLQSRLKTQEEQLLAAQTASEQRVARHEEQLTALREAHNNQLRRVSSSPASGGLRTPQRGLSPMPSPLFPRSPRLAPVNKTAEDETQVVTLRRRVAELEKAAADADVEMQGVVAKMSAAQIEVMTLQEEREAAVRETKRLQRALEAEQVKAHDMRFKALSTNVN